MIVTMTVINNSEILQYDSQPRKFIKEMDKDVDNKSFDNVHEVRLHTTKIGDSQLDIKCTDIYVKGIKVVKV